MGDDVREVLVGTIIGLAAAALIIFSIQYPAQPRHDTPPTACADIPEANERIIIVRDGKVECHYKITRVKQK